jgi:hypothetical protein
VNIVRWWEARSSRRRVEGQSAAARVLAALTPCQIRRSKSDHSVLVLAVILSSGFGSWTACSSRSIRIVLIAQREKDLHSASEEEETVVASLAGELTPPAYTAFRSIVD